MSDQLSGLLDASTVRSVLLAKCAGNQKDWAIKNGVSPAYVSDVILGRRDPGDSILAALGMQKRVFYSYVNSPSIASTFRSSKGGAA